MADVGATFARHLAAKRWDDLRQLLAGDVRFKGVTPGRFWRAETPTQVVTDVLQEWFGDSDHIEELVDVETDDVVDRHRVRYRLKVRNADGLHLVEQQGYYDVTADGRIGRVDLMCAGFRPIPRET